MSYEIDQGVIRSARGIPRAPRWFADGRLAVAWDEGGVETLEFIGNRASDGNNIHFLRGVFDAPRCFLNAGGLSYTPNYVDAEIWPFGVVSSWRVNDLDFRLGVYAVEQSLVMALHTPKALPEGHAFAMHFYEECQLIPANVGNYRLTKNGMDRTWRPWVFDRDNSLLAGGFSETAEDRLNSWSQHIVIGGGAPLEHAVSAIHNRHTLTCPALSGGRDYCFVITFDRDPAACAAHNRALSGGLKAALAAQFDRYRDVQKRMPRLETPYPALNRFFTLAPMYHEALKVPESPGALRAKTSHYWVWGWDSMIAGQGALYWDDAAFMRQMLFHIRETSDPARGLAHAYNYAGQPASIMVDAAQGIFICLLYHVYELTADLAVLKEFLPFARGIVDRMLKSRIGDSGLFEGSSLFPDFPKCLKETGEDISLYNNTLAYCALTSYERIAALLGEDGQAAWAREVILCMRRDLDEALFDQEMGFYVNSADARTRQQRDTYNACGVMWETQSLRELVGPRMAKSACFMEKHCVSSAGIRAIPVWDAAFDGDANQIHCTWPVMDEFFLNCMADAGKTDLLEKWIVWVSYWTDLLLCPEGVSYFFETERPEPDRWNGLNGTFQAYSMRKWYQDAIHCILGILPDAGGLTFAPTGLCAYTLRAFPWQGKRLTIRSEGTGRFVERLFVDGKPLSGTNKIPSDWLTNSASDISVKLGEKGHTGLHLISCDGAALTDWLFEDGEISFALSGAGEHFLYFYAPTPAQALLDGAALGVTTTEKENVYRAQFILRAEEMVHLCLTCKKS